MTVLERCTVSSKSDVTSSSHCTSLEQSRDEVDKMSAGMYCLHTLIKMLEALSELSHKNKQLARRCDYFEQTAELMKVQNQWLNNTVLSSVASSSASPQRTRMQRTVVRPDQRRRSADRRKSGTLIVPSSTNRMRSISQDNSKLSTQSPTAGN